MTTLAESIRKGNIKNPARTKNIKGKNRVREGVNTAGVNKLNYKPRFILIDSGSMG